LQEFKNTNMPRTQAADHALKVDEILDRAAQAFAHQGFPSASMASIAKACGTSKARLYHYFDTKEAILFELLNRYTQSLMRLITQVQGEAQRAKLTERETFGLLIRRFLIEYERAATRHIALTNDVKFLSPAQQAPIIDAQRAVVAAFEAQLRRAFPQTVDSSNQAPLAMMVFGMINWTFTWLKPGGALTYAEFGELVFEVLQRGLQHKPSTSR
jgi:AcrR family transcriptional regulator